MRPYRGKTKEGKWVKGWYFYEKLNDKHFILVEPSFLADSRFDAIVGHVEVIPETVRQFTGLTDKNGKEIYEGDILLNDKDAECMPGEKYIVKYLPGHFVAGGILGAGDHIGEDCKIIGNIHSNPELMSGDTE